MLLEINGKIEENAKKMNEKLDKLEKNGKEDKKEIIDIIGSQIQKNNRKIGENRKKDKEEIIKNINEMREIYIKKTKKKNEE